MLKHWLVFFGLCLLRGVCFASEREEGEYASSTYIIYVCIYIYIFVSKLWYMHHVFRIQFSSSFQERKQYPAKNVPYAHHPRLRPSTVYGFPLPAVML
uniref:Secreted protein n=1 Tax=Anopheles darlingi TaxID=43151 RepID=A0A2M4DEG2_ANODA